MAEQPTTPPANEDYAKASFEAHASNRPLADVPSLINPELPAEAQERMKEIQEILTKFKDKLLKKFEGYIAGVALLPPIKDKDGKVDDKKISTLVLIDDTDSTKLTKEELKQKLTKVIEEVAKEVDENILPEVYLYTDVWQHCYDSKYDMLQLLAMAAPVHDNGMLAAIKIAEVHKTMVLKKFEKYIVSYVLAGSLVQGKATASSDIDVFIVIDDTDVKKMTRFELKERLRGIILQLAAEAGEITGVKNKINIQTYILTDFWDSVKEANPIIYTFLRDGVPFFDRGIFMPWKQLLRMGRIRPSPEAVDIYVNTGQQYFDRVKVKMKEIGMEDFFWAILYPSQAVLMMSGLPPPTPKESPGMMREVFVKKEKLLEEKYVKTLEKVIQVRKELEHGSKATITGKEIDELYEESQEYLDRITELAKQIEGRAEEETIVAIYDSTIAILRDILRLDHIEKVTENDVIPTFLEYIGDKGFIAQKHLRMIEDIEKAKKDYDAKKLSKPEIEKIRKTSSELSKTLVEFIQRKRGYEIERLRVLVKYGNVYGEVLLLDDMAYIVRDIDAKEKELMKAPISKDGTLGPAVETDWTDYEKAIMEAKLPKDAFIKESVFDQFKNIFGKDVQIMLKR